MRYLLHSEWCCAGVVVWYCSPFLSQIAVCQPLCLLVAFKVVIFTWRRISHEQPLLRNPYFTVTIAGVLGYLLACRWGPQCSLAVSLDLLTCLFCCYLLYYIFVPLVEFLSRVFSAPGPGIKVKRLDLIDMIVKQTNSDGTGKKIRPWLASMDSELFSNSIQGRVSHSVLLSRCLGGLLLRYLIMAFLLPNNFFHYLAVLAHHIVWLNLPFLFIRAMTGKKVFPFGIVNI